VSSVEPETKQKILQAARELIEERRGGYVRLSDIGRRAGVSRQAVYLHFSSRFQLLERLADYVDEVEDVDSLIAWVLKAETPAELLDRIPQLHAIHRPKVAAVATALDHALLEEPSLVNVWRSRIEGRRQLAEVAVKRIADAGALAPRWDLEEAIDFVCSIGSFHSWQELTEEHGWSADHYAKVISTTLRESLLIEHARTVPRGQGADAAS
jgi:AcrR family transcriptional regulator